MGYTNAQGTHKQLSGAAASDVSFVWHGGDLSYADDWFVTQCISGATPKSLIPPQVQRDPALLRQLACLLQRDQQSPSEHSARTLPGVLQHSAPVWREA